MNLKRRLIIANALTVILHYQYYFSIV